MNEKTQTASMSAPPLTPARYLPHFTVVTFRFSSSARCANNDCPTLLNIKSFMPRADPNYSDRKTDIFALGSTFYYIMQGHEPFPDLDPFDDEEQIETRFTSRQFPKLESLLMNRVTHKCWAGEYDSAEAVLQDLGSDAACPVSEGVREEAMQLGIL